MENRLKEHLRKIADSLTPESTLEDVYEQLALLEDIELSEKEVKEGKVVTQAKVKEMAQSWLK
ncbi:hypothetical protein QWY31_09620 [Cytophagales bacterium LB-30]|uniref:Uncharacterized protein n=1 Tax=Shiella aurantiaca TaxID=3058365 RepID=A0ABT8F6A1_9BACT|nr:hypothetical protein [Shiella aurantiaca]MDN4165761.1 hypothetical protein [Shiella aurantiaca]